MSDLIDRQALIADIDKLLPVDPLRDDYTQGRTTGLALAMERIKNAPSALSTNLASLGTDCISRQAAIKATWQDTGFTDPFNVMTAIRDRIEQLPSAQPEIIRCRECKFASGDSRICMKFDHSPIGELDFCSFAERREVNNESN